MSIGEHSATSAMPDARHGGVNSTQGQTMRKPSTLAFSDPEESMGGPEAGAYRPGQAGMYPVGSLARPARLEAGDTPVTDRYRWD